MSNLEVTGIHIYPVKSMKGIDLQQSPLMPEGLRRDRRWMVVRYDGRFVTQRQLPKLALVRTALRKNGVELALEGHGSLFVQAADSGGETIHSNVWGDACKTVDQGEEVSRWLTSALECRDVLRLVRMAPGFVRPQGKPDLLGDDTRTCFADTAPFLVANESTLEALNRTLLSRGHSPVPMNRFRPNIVVRGMKPFSEHQISDISHANYQLRFCHPCERCVVTTVDQDTGVRHPGREPYLTLRDINPMPGNEKAPAFAHNAILARGKGSHISVGDSLAVNILEFSERLHA